MYEKNLIFVMTEKFGNEGQLKAIGAIRVRTENVIEHDQTVNLHGTTRENEKVFASIN